MTTPTIRLTIKPAPIIRGTVRGIGLPGPAGADGSFAPVADSTLVGNVSGGSAIPVGLPKATIKSLLNFVEPSELTWASIANKPATFAPSAHSHPLSDLTGLGTGVAAALALSASGSGGGFARTDSPTFNADISTQAALKLRYRPTFNDAAYLVFENNSGTQQGAIGCTNSGLVHTNARHSFWNTAFSVEQLRLTDTAAVFAGTVNGFTLDVLSGRGRIFQGAGVGTDIQANEAVNPLFRVSYAGAEFPFSVSRNLVAVTGNITASGTVTAPTFAATTAGQLFNQFNNLTIAATYGGQMTSPSGWEILNTNGTANDTLVVKSQGALYSLRSNHAGSDKFRVTGNTGDVWAAGNITASGTLTTGGPYSSLQAPQVRFCNGSGAAVSAFELVAKSGATDASKYQWITGYADSRLELYTQSSSGGTYDTRAMQVTRSGQVTFDQSTTVNGTFVAAGGCVRLISDGTNGYVDAFGSGAASLIFRVALDQTALTINASKHATFAGNITASGTLGFSQSRFQQSAAQTLQTQCFDTSLSAWQETMRQQASPTGAKWSVFGATPVIQPAAIADTTGAILMVLEGEVNKVKQAIRSLGLIAP